jgi:class 3 adenylate cyclase
VTHSADEAGPTETADAESRFVTLLKFDLVGSTELSKSLTASDELDLKRAYVSAVERLVRPELVKIEWEGDGGLLVFGYPAARVDAAEAAVRTGLKLIDAVRAVNVMTVSFLAVPGRVVRYRTAESTI